jgi:hypothetical protein
VGTKFAITEALPSFVFDVSFKMNVFLTSLHHLITCSGIILQQEQTEHLQWHHCAQDQLLPCMTHTCRLPVCVFMLVTGMQENAQEKMQNTDGN